LRHETLRVASTVLLLAQGFSTLAPAQTSAQFAADIVSRDAGGASLGATAKLHAAKPKTRIEISGPSDGFFINDSEAGTAVFVRPAQRLYGDSRQSTPLMQIFVWVDPKDPCRQWRVAAAAAGVLNAANWHCELIEHASVNGREILEYRVLAPDLRSRYGWVDASMGYPVKWQTADGKIFALENIAFEAQPPNLFSIPPDYRKLDPHALLERIKHSDVWAAPSAK
jgi:hypothetical protein